MRRKQRVERRVPSHTWLAKSAPFEPGPEREGPGLAVPHPRAPGSRRPMRLTDRDVAILNLVLRARALRDDQIQLALFSPGNASGCQRRLTRLVGHRYLDRLPRRSVIEPAVYLLTRRSTRGNRLLRQVWGEAEVQRQMGRLGPIPHLLAVNDVRVRVERACVELGWQLIRWDTPEQLAEVDLQGLLPDAYFQIRRLVEGRPLTSAFFLEVERATKSHRVLRSKLERAFTLQSSGRYEHLFGTKALRLLVVFDTLEADARRRTRAGLAAARDIGVPNVRFGYLPALKTTPPIECLIGRRWLAPELPNNTTAQSAESEPQPLFSVEELP